MKRAMRDDLTHRRIIIQASSAEGTPLEHPATALALMSFCELIKNHLRSKHY